MNRRSFFKHSALAVGALTMLRDLGLDVSQAEKVGSFENAVEPIEGDFVAWGVNSGDQIIHRTNELGQPSGHILYKGRMQFKGVMIGHKIKVGDIFDLSAELKKLSCKYTAVEGVRFLVMSVETRFDMSSANVSVVEAVEHSRA